MGIRLSQTLNVTDLKRQVLLALCFVVGRDCVGLVHESWQGVSIHSMASSLQKELHRAVEAIRCAKALIFTSGAGMGVDSGLPDFRGPEGFWRAYPALKGRGLQLQSMSTPHWFNSDPQFAWGFFGHRYNLYSQTVPHPGFKIILDWARQMELGYFAFTSNVDGHLQVIFQTKYSLIGQNDRSWET